MAIDYNELYQTQLRNLKKHLDLLPSEGVRGAVRGRLNHQEGRGWFMWGALAISVLAFIGWLIFKSSDAGLSSFLMTLISCHIFGCFVLMGFWDLVIKCPVENDSDKEKVSSSLLKLLKDNPKLAKHFAPYLEHSERNEVKQGWSSMFAIYLSGLSTAKNLQLDDIPEHREEVKRMVYQACQEDGYNSVLPTHTSKQQEQQVQHSSWIFWNPKKQPVLTEETPKHLKSERWNM